VNIRSRTVSRIGYILMDQRDRRRAAQREKQQKEILDAALVAFAESGYRGASMDRIARAAGYSVGHVYNVFGNKEALFDAVLTREGTDLATLVNATIAAHRDDVRACINDLVDRTLAFFDSHREFFTIYLSQAGGIRANVERVFPPRLGELKRDTDRRVRGLFARAVREGLTVPLPPRDMAVAMAELVNGFVAAWAADGYRGRISGKAKVIKHMLWKGIGA
jgi:AcrR family transcriptional regulator